LNNREGAIVVWDEGLAAFAHALGEVSAEHGASHARAEAIQWGFSTHVCTSSSWSRRVTDLDRTLQECQTLLCLQA
jgi:hypothetical protein